MGLLELRKHLCFFPNFKCLKTIFNESKISFEDQVSIVCIAKNEGEYIKEWIEFHLKQGIDKIYIYDNESPDNMKSILEPYINENKVIYNLIIGKGKQLEAYNHAIENYRNKTKYMVFIDVDEFLMPENIGDNLIDIIFKLMNSKNRIGCLGVNWRMYGSSGYTIKKDDYVIKRFIYRGNDNAKGNECIKSIVNPRYVCLFQHVHYPQLERGFLFVNEEGRRIYNWENKTDKTKYLRINHYFTKSKEEWIERRSKGKADSNSMQNNRTIDEFYQHDNNDILDMHAVEIAKKIGML